MLIAHAHAIGAGTYVQGGLASSPLTENVTLPGTARYYDVTEVNNVSVTNFSRVVGTLIGLTTSGSPTGVYIQLSTDGGSTFDGATGDYLYWRMGGNSNVSAPTDTSGLILSNSGAGNTQRTLFHISNMNADGFPVVSESCAMSPDGDQGNQDAWEGSSKNFTPKNAFRIGVFGGTTPLMTAGTLRLEGFR